MVDEALRAAFASRSLTIDENKTHERPFAIRGETFGARQFIKEAGGEDIRCLVVGDKVVASMKRKGKEGEFRSNLHRGGSAESVISGRPSCAFAEQRMKSAARANSSPPPRQ